MDFSGAGTKADHAYWLSGIALRDGGGAAPLGTVDARSLGFGQGDPQPGATQTGSGSLTGGNLGSIAYTSQTKGWGATPRTARADVLDLTVRNVGHVTVHRERARLTCAADLRVDTDGPVTVDFAGCGRTETFQRSGGSACASRAGFRSVRMRPRGGRLRVAFSRRVARPVTVEVFRNSRGRRVLGNRRVARFTGRTRSFTWRARGRRIGDGVYTVRLRIRVGGRTDVRRHVVERRRGRFRARGGFERRRTCAALPFFRAPLPVFGGTNRRALSLSYRLNTARRVRVTVLRGGRTVRRFKPRARRAGRTYRLRIPARRLRRGSYRVRLTHSRPRTRTQRYTINVQRL
jgi:hypothetical protein